VIGQDVLLQKQMTFTEYFVSRTTTKKSTYLYFYTENLIQNAEGEIASQGSEQCEKQVQEKGQAPACCKLTFSSTSPQSHQIWK
jgi:hypothetical protein